MPPKAAAASSTITRTASASRRSACATTWPDPGSDVTSAFAASRLALQWTATTSPSCANPSQIAAPIPRDPPVTRMRRRPAPTVIGPVCQRVPRTEPLAHLAGTRSMGITGFSQADRLLAALIHHDGGAVRVKCVLEECEVERAPEQRAARGSSQSRLRHQMSIGHRGQWPSGAGRVSCRVRLSSRRPLRIWLEIPLALRRRWVAPAYLLTWSVAWHQACPMTGRDVDLVVPA